MIKTIEANKVPAMVFLFPGQGLSNQVGFNLYT